MDLSNLGQNVLAAMDAAATQTVDPSAAAVLDAYFSANGKANVRGSAQDEEEAAPAAPGTLRGDASYTRPNGDVYHTRDWGAHTDVRVLIEAREKNHYVLLYGEPGCGKTALIEAAFGAEVHTVIGSGDTEVSDFIGSFVQMPDGTYVWQDGPLLRAMENGEVLNVDEIGLIDTKVLSIVYPVMDGRAELTVTANPERGTVKAKEGFYVVAATNPNAPGVRLSEALLSRFTVQAEMTTDYGLARKLGVPAKIVTCAQNLNKKQREGETRWAPQMRELLAFRDLAPIFGEEFAIRNLLAATPVMERPIVNDVIQRVYGKEFLAARI